MVKIHLPSPSGEGRSVCFSQCFGSDAKNSAQSGSRSSAAGDGGLGSPGVWMGGAYRSELERRGDRDG